ncbi:creatininase family protein [Dysgonomonas sp. 520]|uniref:creatininase family protein n=1 Tax=Dysgonomonas sp. 520 TaxID=2302931 RepID=UPI0013D65255|nr:creatininase family protein [Dysgonomonas sp. 520]NDW09852.1 creatininase family protein [Dysgonomonas sp. 520]
MLDRNIAINLQREVYGNIKDKSYSYAVLPWGATEPHNYHLPYLTDCYLAHAIAVDSVGKAYDRYNVLGMVLPPIPLGSQNPGQRELPFCLHTRYETQKHILSDIVESLNYQGIKTLIIVNGHGGNSFKPMIRDLNVNYPEMLIAVSDWFTIEPQNKYLKFRDDHAGELETSVMLHYYPELVKMELAGNGEGKPFAVESLNEGVAWIPRNWSKVSVDTGIGNPHKSTAEKGKMIAEAVTDKLAKLFNELVTKDIYDAKR